MMISMRKWMRKKTVKTMQLQLKSGQVTRLKSQHSMVIVFWIYFQTKTTNPTLKLCQMSATCQAMVTVVIWPHIKV